MQETWVWSLEGEDPQKEIATHTWEIPWTEEPGQSTESQRIRHKLATKQQPQQAAISHVSCYLTLQNCIIYLIKPILGLKCLKTLTGKAKAHILMCNYHLNPSWKQRHVKISSITSLPFLSEQTDKNCVNFWDLKKLTSLQWHSMVSSSLNIAIILKFTCHIHPFTKLSVKS